MFDISNYMRADITCTPPVSRERVTRVQIEINMTGSTALPTNSIDRDIICYRDILCYKRSFIDKI